MLVATTEVFAAFSEFIHPFDADAAVWYATIVAQRDRLGLPIDGFDVQMAAICRTHGAVLATRNAKGFRETGIDLIDPWQLSQPADRHRQPDRQLKRLGSSPNTPAGSGYPSQGKQRNCR